MVESVNLSGIDHSKVVDLRRVSEWMSYGVLKDSNLVTFESRAHVLSPLFLPKIRTLFAKNDTIFLMCGTGRRSKRAAELLAQNGYTAVKSIFGGASFQQKLGVKFETYCPKL